MTGDRSVERLREALRIPTISRLDESLVEWDEFDRFIHTLQQLYPLVHASLEREIVAGHSLLFRWVGRAAEGCELWEDGVCARVPGVTAREVRDPTGCGDAWRGALLYGLEQGWPLARCAVLGNRLGAIKVAASGPQNYTVDRQALLEG